MLSGWLCVTASLACWEDKVASVQSNKKAKILVGTSMEGSESCRQCMCFEMFTGLSQAADTCTRSTVRCGNPGGRVNQERLLE